MPSAHRRFTAWAAAGFFDRLHREVLDRLGAGGEAGWSATIVDSAYVRAKRHPRGSNRQAAAVSVSCDDQAVVSS